MKPCVVIGASPDCTFPAGFSAAGSYVICADGGFAAAAAHGIAPDVVIGDFDSLPAMPAGDFEVYALPREKDDTDLLAAVKLALERGYRQFQILGALGGRLDHTYGNLSVLQFIAERGGSAVLEDGNAAVFLRRAGDAPLVLERQAGRTVSVFPFGAAQCVVTYQGLQYPLEHGMLSSGTPRGVSNVIVNSHAQIMVEAGAAIVIVLKGLE